jgi:predicted membrane channel-forming protein YqfA (hemolysin III family)
MSDTTPTSIDMRRNKRLAMFLFIVMGVSVISFITYIMFIA